MTKVLSIKTENLYKNIIPTNGFIHPEDPISENFYNHSFLELIDREEADKNIEYKQLIPYISFVDDVNKKVYTFQRSSSSSYKEEKLRGKYSVGIGGHIDEEDVSYNDNGIIDLEKTLLNNIQREVNEEIELKFSSTENRFQAKPVMLGFINDDSNTVGKMHLGISYIVFTNMDIIKKDSEILNGEWVSVDCIDNLMKSTLFEFETWSKFIYPLLSGVILIANQS